MNILREVGGELLNMFVADISLAIGIVTVVSLAGLLTTSGAVPTLIGGAVLFLGCVVLLVASVVLAGRHYHGR